METLQATELASYSVFRINTTLWTYRPKEHQISLTELASKSVHLAGLTISQECAPWLLLIVVQDSLLTKLIVNASFPLIVLDLLTQSLENASLNATSMTLNSWDILVTEIEDCVFWYAQAIPIILATIRQNSVKQLVPLPAK